MEGPSEEPRRRRSRRKARNVSPQPPRRGGRPNRERNGLMRRPRPDPLAGSIGPREKIRIAPNALGWGALGLLLLPSLALGAVHPWAANLLVAAACVLLCGWYDAGGRVQMRPAGWLLAAAAGWALLGLVPLPEGLVRLLSPYTAAVWDATGSWQGGGTALAPGEVLRGLLSVLPAVAAFLLFSRRGPTRLASGLTALAMTGLGGGLVLIGLAHRFANAESIYGLVEVSTGQAFFAPLVQPNHLAGQMVLLLGVAVGLLVELLTRAEEKRERPPWSWRGLPAVVALLLVLICFGLVEARSRGGLLGAAAVLTSFALMFLLARGRRRWAGAVAGGAGLLTLSGLVVPGVWYDRLSRFVDKPQHLERLELWGDALGILRRSPLTGVGLGGFSAAFPMSRTHPGFYSFPFAENEFLQSALELGLPGALALWAGLALLLWRPLKRVWSDGSSHPETPDALRMGAGAGALGLLVHSGVDFHLHIPSTLVLFATCLSLFAASRRRGRGQRSTTEVAALRGPRMLWLGVAAAGVVLVLAPFGPTVGSLRDPRSEQLTAIPRMGGWELPIRGGDHQVLLARQRPGERDHHLGQAERFYRASLRRFPGAPEAWLGLGRVLHIQGELEPALSALDAAVALSPMDFRMPLQRARLRAALNRPDALDDYRAAFQLHPGSPERLVREMLANLDDPAEVASLMPDGAGCMPLGVASQTVRDQAGYAAARPIFARLPACSGERIPELDRWARAAWLAGEEADVALALEAWPVEATDCRRDGWVGVLSLMRGQADAARASFLEAAERCPRRVEFSVQAARASVALGEHRGAVRELRALARRYPEAPQPWAELARIYARDENPRRVAQSAERAWALGAEGLVLPVLWLEALVDLEQPEQAATVLAELGTRFAERPQGLLRVARAGVRLDIEGGCALLRSIETEASCAMP